MMPQWMCRSSQSGMNFLDLPAEVRLKIYEEVYVASEDEDSANIVEPSPDARSKEFLTNLSEHIVETWPENFDVTVCLHPLALAYTLKALFSSH